MGDFNSDWHFERSTNLTIIIKNKNCQQNDKNRNHKFFSFYFSYLRVAWVWENVEIFMALSKRENANIQVFVKFFYSFWHFSSYYWQFHFLYYYPKIIFKSLTTCCWCLKNCRCHEVLSAVELCLLSEKRKQLRRFLKLFDFVSYQIENHILITPTYQVSKRVKA